MGEEDRKPTTSWSAPGQWGLAFTDTLVSESDANSRVVDRNDQAKGYRTTAYPLGVRLGPAVGVLRGELGESGHRQFIDRGGFNAG